MRWLWSLRSLDISICSPAKSKKTRFAPAKEASASMADYDVMYRRAIQEVYRDNRKKLDDWFDTLEKIATEEIAKALGKAEE